MQLHDVTIFDIIKASYHQFYLGGISNGASNNDLTGKDHNNDSDVDNFMVLTNNSERDKVLPSDIMKLISIPNPYSTQEIKDIIINGKLHFKFNTSTCQPTTAHVVNH